MLDTIIGIKQKMGVVYIADRRFPVTWVKVDPCIVTQVKHLEKDGYMAVQLGTGSKRNKNLTKPLQNHLKKALEAQKSLRAGGSQEPEAKDNKSPRYLREVRVKEESDLKIGDAVKVVDVLKRGDMVTVTGISKGKGFAGVVKRWGFAGGPKTHGQSDRERAPGSIGQRTTPGRVYKGKKMAGRMGQDRVTVKSLVVVDIDEKNNLVAITGAAPGVNGGLIYIKKTGESRLKAQLDEEKKQVENQEQKKEGNKESLDKAQDKQVESSSAPDDAEAMSGKEALADKQEEVKSASVQDSGEIKEEIKDMKKEENEELKSLNTEKQEGSKTEKKELVQEEKGEGTIKSEESDAEVTK